MAALVLSVAGAAAGGALFGPAGAIAGRIVGALAGNAVDHALFGQRIEREVQGPRLADLDVMSSTEGAPIPRVYGRLRLSGQVIWATRLEEVVTVQSETTGGQGRGGKGFGSTGSRVTTTRTAYSYFANFAVGLCEGVIGRIGRVWADGKPLDLAGLAYRVHLGTDQQAADPLIVAKEGAEDAPAYRGLAYVVFERMPLADFGNRIPQLSFEIIRPVGRLERMIRSVTLIPGTTEFGYEPSTVVRLLGPGRSAPENRHVRTHVSDVEAALDDLEAACPNLERVAVVVAWFGDDLRADRCVIKPGVDSAAKVTHGATWMVAGLARGAAHVVSTVDGRPAYGGTPSDQSVLNLIAELKARGLKITLYPFVMMDIPSANALADPWTGAASQPAYPWRGRITCNPAPGRPASPDGTPSSAPQIASFFGVDAPGEWTYRRMVLHYANLAVQAGGVDAFLIGSELRGLTRVRSAPGIYPAVDQLVALASDVRSILGASTAITYGADWTEYGAHVVDGGATEVRFPLDPLWASPDIDAVGIDFYAPLSDWRDGATHLDRTLADSIYDPDYLAGNLRAGEAYDWYYADQSARDAQIRTPITDGLGKEWIFRAKDMWNWWANPHVERVAGAELAVPTGWVPQSKPIWLTEAGCPAVDKGANQPSTFPDAKSADGGLPYFSDGRRDDAIQRRWLESVLATFDPNFGATPSSNPVSAIYSAPMVDPSTAAVWTWDARPFPTFPHAVDVWSDGANWATGHWLTGRLGTAPLSDLVTAMCDDASMADVHAGALVDGPDGYIVDRPMSLRAALEPLTLAYCFDAAEIDGMIRFRPRGGAPAAELDENDVALVDDHAPVRLTRAQETELPREVSLAFTDSGTDFRRSAVSSRRLVGASARGSRADLAVVSNAAAMLRRAEIWLQDLWAGREEVTFRLPPSALRFTPGDVLALTVRDRRRILEIKEIVDAQSRLVTARTIDPGVFDWPLPEAQARTAEPPPSLSPAHAWLLDLPTLTADEPPVLTRAAVYADPWPGAISVWRSHDGLTFSQIALAAAPAVIGETIDPLPRGAPSRWNLHHGFRVRLYGGTLSSMPDVPLFEGGNVGALRRSDGAWEVFQFGNAELVGDRIYRLTRLLRGQAGSEWAMGDPLMAGAPFVLLDERVVPVARGIESLGRAMRLRLVAADRTHGDPAHLQMDWTPGDAALRPFAPVHLRAKRTDDGVLISFVRRARRDGDNWAPVDVPLGEDSERYEIDVLSGVTVLRTLVGAQPFVLYSNADELSDFGAQQTALSVRVAQISAVVGRGVIAAATLTT